MTKKPPMSINTYQERGLPPLQAQASGVAQGSLGPWHVKDESGCSSICKEAGVKVSREDSGSVSSRDPA